MPVMDEIIDKLEETETRACLQIPWDACKCHQIQSIILFYILFYCMHQFYASMLLSFELHFILDHWIEPSFLFLDLLSLPTLIHAFDFKMTRLNKKKAQLKVPITF